MDLVSTLQDSQLNVQLIGRRLKSDSGENCPSAICFWRKASLAKNLFRIEAAALEVRHLAGKQSFEPSHWDARKRLKSGQTLLPQNGSCQWVGLPRRWLGLRWSLIKVNSPAPTLPPRFSFWEAVDGSSTSSGLKKH